MTTFTKSTLINVGLTIASLTIFFLGIEYTLRITGLQQVQPNPPQIYQHATNPDISYELRPNLQHVKAYRAKVSTDALGMRLNGKTMNADTTVLLLGDSIAFGYGVEDNETLAARIEAKLQNVRVLNAGVPGFHLGMETALYKEKGEQLHPDLLLLQFHYNDFDPETGWLDDIGIIRSPHWQPSDTSCTPIETGMLGWIPGKCWLDLHSAFYKAFKKLVNLRSMQDALVASQKESQEHPAKDGITELQLATYANQLRAFTAEVDPALPRLFIIWPDRYVHTVSRPKVRTLAEQQGFTVVDLYDTFGNEAETLGWDTVHPSAKTVDTAATVIVDTMKKEELVNNE